MLSKCIVAVGNVTDVNTLLYSVFKSGRVIVESDSRLVFICILKDETAVDGVITEILILSDGQKEDSELAIIIICMVATK